MTLPFEDSMRITHDPHAELERKTSILARQIESLEHSHRKLGELLTTLRLPKNRRNLSNVEGPNKLDELLSELWRIVDREWEQYQKRDQELKRDD